MMTAQIHRVALVPRLRQLCLVFVPAPRAKEHPVDQQHRRLAFRRGGTFDEDREITDAIDLWRHAHAPIENATAESEYTAMRQ